MMNKPLIPAAALAAALVLATAGPARAQGS